MAKKKRGHPDLEELLNRPWCYYCERDFDDLKILISHQKAKHFKCDRCGRRLNTAGGLSVHMSQVHKETLTAVDNALPNRSSLDVEIFGMEGVPEDVLQAHHQRVMTQFQQAEAERRAVTGNPAPGTAGAGGAGGGGGQSKRPKFEKPSELKRRLAEHKAKLAAEQAAGSSSGSVTPVGAGQAAQAGAGFTATQQYPPTGQQQPLNGSGPQQAYPQPYGQTSAVYQPAAPQYQIQPEYPVPGYQYPAGTPYQNPQFSPQTMSPSQYQAVPAALPQRPLSTSTPPVTFPPQPQQALRTHTPPQPASPFTHRPPSLPSLPAAPGLPQRPSFGAPQVNAFQMQQMHHGQIAVPPTTATPPYGGVEATQARGHETTSTSLDELISGAAKQADELAGKSPQPPAKTEEATGENKPAKKEKEKSKATRLVYSDSEFSPEEKMARLPRYAYVPERKAETVV
ncbi:hypothetical protein AJ80_07548 [Polytolypa hystricis UAMH7299]|uniref:C2H2-type domain-containing protein n=1 Tax=Polytolypa hystricis (strain UAMH7299) TaxID=1447883 RepID=A0A2B7XMJ3_POLH7|nr:hypothetical protein AJ80_07548 [Polytolypa hystricis UAMH7299]